MQQPEQASADIRKEAARKAGRKAPWVNLMLVGSFMGFFACAPLFRGRSPGLVYHFSLVKESWFSLLILPGVVLLSILISDLTKLAKIDCQLALEKQEQRSKVIGKAVNRCLLSVFVIFVGISGLAGYTSWESWPPKGLWEQMRVTFPSVLIALLYVPGWESLWYNLAWILNLPKADNKAKADER